MNHNKKVTCSNCFELTPFVSSFSTFFCKNDGTSTRLQITSALGLGSVARIPELISFVCLEISRFYGLRVLISNSTGLPVIESVPTKSCFDSV